MRYLSLFSGIEAATVAWSCLGWECAAVSEIDPFCCALLEHHYPHIPNLGDVTKCDLNHKVAAGAALCFPALNPEGASWSDLS